ncbi:septum site-determining protein MinC [Massilimicrobiota sp. SW1139]|uniref:septum site-determining protein MinC n=1 Tax=Massilimicrobiota sp. SW1139 TaxID=2530043 RepID=UPI0014396246|nr:septum site-determining protein MinC [Massilimicrobiota sp. SW1139]NJE43617.1 hypothetical protein [Massilimicrobiota sp. SW1139]
MNIEVKGINGILVMKVNENCTFQQFLDDLNQLLEQPLFQQEGYYPRAFFDFGCRVLANDEVHSLMDLLMQKEKVLFDGMTYHQQPHQVHIRKEQLHNGEEIIIDHETLFLGIVNPGSYVYCYQNVYFLNTVKGTIVAMNEDVRIFGHDFQNAQIIINQQTLHDLTTSALTSVYYKDNQIILTKEENYVSNYSHYVG